MGDFLFRVRNLRKCDPRNKISTVILGLSVIIIPSRASGGSKLCTCVEDVLVHKPNCWAEDNLQLYRMSTSRYGSNVRANGFYQANNYSLSARVILASLESALTARFG